jgi:hypothetical protein
MTTPRKDEIDRLARELQAEEEEKKAQAERLRKKTKANVVLFAATTAEEKKNEPPSLAEILDRLVAMDDVEYERCRRSKAREWDIRLTALDRLREEAMRRRREFAPKQAPQPDPNDLESRLRPILETEGILDLWLQSWDRVMAGEHRNAKLLYLVATSRLFDNCMHVAIKGPSSGGKSEIRRQVLEFFPPEDIVTFTTMSDRNQP